MKSLSELATIYEIWAETNEARAAEILASLDSLSREIREQRWHADELLADATAMKIRAKELRDGGMIEIIEAATFRSDRDEGCDGPQATMALDAVNPAVRLLDLKERRPE